MIIDIFAPYIPFTVTVICIIINLIYIFKSSQGSNGFNIWGLLILNIVIMLTTNVIAELIPSLDGYIQYDLISLILDEVLKFVEGTFADLWDLIF